MNKAITALVFLSTTVAHAAAPAGDTPEALAKILEAKLAKTSWIAGCRTKLRVASADRARCAELDQTVKLSKRVYLQDDQRFVSLVSSALARIHGETTYNYLPILLAALSRDPRFTGPLANLEKVEQSHAAIKFKYGSRARDMVTDGGCSESDPETKSFAFREICHSLDQEFTAIRLTKGIK